MEEDGIGWLQVSVGLDPKPPIRSEADGTEGVFVEVGRACARFEALQDELIVLFHVLCGGGAENTSQMAMIIGSTSSFSVKLDLTRAATKALVEDERTRNAVLGWLKLCGRAAEVRNKIAHGRPTIVHYVHEGENLVGAFLTPSLYDTKAYGKLSAAPKTPNFIRFRWSAGQVRAYSDTFLELRTLMMLMREQLTASLDPPMPVLLDPDTQVRPKGV